MIESPALKALPGVSHGFFTREGGASTGLYAGLNCGFGSGDERANVARNRAHVRQMLEADALITAYQVHSATVHRVTRPWPPGEAPEGDAMVTDVPGIALGILTADCAPILLADRQAGVIGAAHAGWKGAVGGVLTRTVEAMEALGATRASITAAIGPAISARNYEIGEEMAQTIRSNFPHAADFIVTDGFENPHFDVPGLVRREADSLGLKAVETVGGCTYASPDLYFSHRYATHNAIRTGRQIALIALG